MKNNVKKLLHKYKFRRKSFTIRTLLGLWTGLTVFVFSIVIVVLVNLTSSFTRIYQLQEVPVALLLIVSLLWGFSAYIITGAALQPVNELSRAANYISINTLNQRLNIKNSDVELQTLVNAFNSMLDRLEQAFEYQNQFIADAAHELRTPVNNARINLDVISGDSQATIDDYRELAAIIDRNLNRLEHLVSDLFLLTTRPTEEFHKNVNLTALLREVIDNFKASADSKGVNLEFEAGSNLSISGDSTLLNRVFSNLIENGINYNRIGGLVRVNIKQKDNWAIVSVIDNGVGIEEEEKSQIFNRFYRADLSRSRNKGGAGLGLSIVDHIILQHHGQVHVESIPGIGSSFIVKLPLQIS